MAESAQTPEESQPVETTEEKSSPPWGDDFDAQRAWDTITNLRGEVKEAKSASASDEDREILAALNDPERHQEVLDRLGYELGDETGDDEYDEFGLEDEDDLQDPNVERLTRLEAELGRQQEEKDLESFNSHLNDLAQQSEVKLSNRDREYLFLASQSQGFTPQATEKVWKEWAQERENERKGVIEDYVKSKKASPVPSVGTSATEMPNLDDPQTRRAWMAERLEQGRAEG